jgi:hypothetical protein
MRASCNGHGLFKKAETYRIHFGSFEWKRPLAKPWSGCDDNIKIYREKIKYKFVNLVHVPKDGTVGT